MFGARRRPRRRDDLADALGVAAGLHEYFRNSDIIAMANYAQTVNVIGCIKTSKTAAEFATTGLILKMYRTYFGNIPLNIVANHEPYDLSIALTEDRKSVTIGVVNPTDESILVNLELIGGILNTEGTSHSVSGLERDSHNRPGFPREVDMTTVQNVDLSQGLAVPALTSSLFVVGFK